MQIQALRIAPPRDNSQRQRGCARQRLGSGSLFPLISPASAYTYQTELIKTSWLLASNPTPSGASCDTQFDFNKLLLSVTPRLSYLVCTLIKHQVLSPAVWLDGNYLMKSSANPCDPPVTGAAGPRGTAKACLGWSSPFSALPAEVLHLLRLGFSGPLSPSRVVQRGCRALLSRDAAAWQPQVNPPSRTQPWVTGGKLHPQKSGSSASDTPGLSHPPPSEEAGTVDWGMSSLIKEVFHRT